ncbi:MAG TPA: histidine phosphatase family protein, partial [Pseudomonadota bacterium]|nr:histidine phosphatase family protein [Pseudomonadota bacterium]
HEQTAAAMRAGARAAGGELPEGRALPGLDEFPFQAILTAAAARMAAEAAALRAELGGADPLRDRRSFDRLFQRAMTHWITGELAEAALPETFAGFLARAQAGLLTVMAEQGRGRTAAIVTSAGPMAAALQLGLGLADAMVLKLCTVLANTALVELRYRGDEREGASADFSVISFNCTPHLATDLVSYR